MAGLAWPRSAKRPTNGAANAAGTPISENSPIAASPKPYGRAGEREQVVGAGEREQQADRDDAEVRAGGHAGVAAVGEAPDVRGGERGRHADQREQPDRRLAEAVGPRGQHERERGPEDAHEPERERAVGGAQAQHRLAGDERRDRAQQPAVGQRDGRRDVGQPAPQQGGETEHGRGAEPEHGAPAGRLRDEARQRSRQQRADHEARHDRADDPAPLGVGRERGGERDQDLGDDRRDADGGEREAQRPEPGRQGGGGQADRGDEQGGRDEAPAVHEVAERDEQHEAGRVAELADGDEQAGRGVPGVQLARDRVEQRLDVVGVRDAEAAGGGEE